MQAYWPDTVSIQGSNGQIETLINEIMKPRAVGDKPGINLTLDVKQCDTVAGGSSEMNPPLREVPHTALSNGLSVCGDLF